MVEHLAVNEGVVGSSPTSGANSINFTGYPVSIRLLDFLSSVISQRAKAGQKPFMLLFNYE